MSDVKERNSAFCVHLVSMDEECPKCMDLDAPEIRKAITDPVNHPSHYNRGKIEVLEFITDQKLSYERGSIIKYICRAGYKSAEKEIEDLDKAMFYLRWERELVLARREGREPCKPNQLKKESK